LQILNCDFCLFFKIFKTRQGQTTLKGGTQSFWPKSKKDMVAELPGKYSTSNQVVFARKTKKFFEVLL